MKDWISQLSAAVGFVQAMTAPQAPASFVEARSPLSPEIVGFSSSAIVTLNDSVIEFP